MFNKRSLSLVVIFLTMFISFFALGCNSETGTNAPAKDSVIWSESYEKVQISKNELTIKGENISVNGYLSFIKNKPALAQFQLCRKSVKQPDKILLETSFENINEVRLISFDYNGSKYTYYEPEKPEYKEIYDTANKWLFSVYKQIKMDDLIKNKPQWQPLEIFGPPPNGSVQGCFNIPPGSEWNSKPLAFNFDYQIESKNAVMFSKKCDLVLRVDFNQQSDPKPESISLFIYLKDDDRWVGLHDENADGKVDVINFISSDFQKQRDNYDRGDPDQRIQKIFTQADIAINYAAKELHVDDLIKERTDDVNRANKKKEEKENLPVVNPFLVK